MAKIIRRVERRKGGKPLGRANSVERDLDEPAAPGRVPSMEQLIGVVGRPIDAEDVRAVLATLSLEKEGDRLLARPAGVELRVRRKRIVAVYLFTTEWGERKPYRGELVHGLTAAADRSEVRAKMGKPSNIARTGGGCDRYDSERLWIYFSYPFRKPGIDMITLMVPNPTL